MKTYYSSLFLLACGGLYSFFGGGFRPRAARNDSDAVYSPTVVETNSASRKDAPAEGNSSDESTYPDGLCEQFAAVCGSAGPDRQGVRPEISLRDDISSPQLILATVPDPIATHLRVEFDRAMDGIKDAAADERFLFRRYWFPWPIEPGRQFSDRDSQNKEDAQRAEKSHLPGFLLFDRQQNGRHQSLIVLLVGESPTDGINRDQFHRAVRLKQRIEELSRISDPDPVSYILGPFFSGSLYTLQLALAAEKIDRFEAVSGTVSDQSSMMAFRNSIAGFDRSDGHTALSTVLHDSANSLKILQTYIRTTWNYQGKVAVISETDTAFGALQGLNPLGASAPFLLIPFPRDIAHLRNAYQSYPELSAFGPGNPDLQQRKALPLPLEDSRNTIDSIPDYAAQTVVSQETLVSQIVNRIHHERIHFAAIIGSDVLDVLFITHFLRVASPDTRLFLLDPDLLFVHAADALPFEGVLAVTTFPLLDGNLPFVVANRPGAVPDLHWIFSTPFEEGLHNAMRVLISRMQNSRQIELPGYEVVKDGDPPPIWITSVGRESFVPIAYLPGPDKHSEPMLIHRPPGAASVIDPRDPSRLWWILFLAVTFGLAALTLIFYLAQTSHAAWLNDLRIQGDRTHKQQLSLFLIFAAGIYLLVLSTADARFFVSFRPLLFACIGALSLAALAIIWASRIHLGLRELLPIIVTASGVAAVIALFAVLSNRPTGLAGLFFRFRSSELSAGSSPTVPFLFLFGGFLACSFVSLQRHIFHHQRAPSLPKAANDPVLGANVWPLARHLAEYLHEPFRRAWVFNVSVAAIAFLLCWLGLFESGAQSLEGLWYDRLFRIATAVLVAALAVVCSHFLSVWTRLARMLEQLETHPLRHAFSALPSDRAWSPIWQSSPRKRGYLIATRSIEDLKALRATHQWPEHAQLFENAELRVSAILKASAHGNRETPAEHKNAEQDLAGAAEALLESLQLEWAKGGSMILDESANKEGEKDADQENASEKRPLESPPLVYAIEFVAMRYLAFIRYVVLQLRNMLTFLTLGFLAFAFALMSYPFQGERLIAWLITGVFAAIGIVVGLVFTQMETDLTLRRIASRDAGKFSVEFFHRLLAFGALPLLTVLASNFNGVGRLLFSWIEPALKTLH